VYRKIIEDRITSTAKTEMNKPNPIIYCDLECGYRITALRDPISKYPVVNIRIFKQIGEEKEKNFAPEPIKEFIKLLTKYGRRNICIIGPQGAGKTTALENLIIKHLDDDLCCQLNENIHELNIGKKYPNKNFIELAYLGRKPSELTELGFRLNRDIITYGEVRGAEEALEVIKAMLRQCRGSMFTFHSSSTQRTIHDLRQLLMQTGYYTDYHEAQFDAADAIDIVIQIKYNNDTGERYIYKISESIAFSETMTFEVVDLFSYDMETGKYIVNPKGISDNMKKSCLDYDITKEQIRFIESIFKADETNAQEYFVYRG
jgi:pilus assembly protein CpaF